MVVAESKVSVAPLQTSLIWAVPTGELSGT